MNRQIKFRAWDKHYKKFRDIILNNSISALNNNEINERFVLTQYTGLKDKNGIEVYEGDIITCNNKYKSIVSYKNGSFVKSYRNGNIYLLYDSNIEDEILINYEVIGNIYENPDLLEDK